MFTTYIMTKIYVRKLTMTYIGIKVKGIAPSAGM